MLVVGAGPIGLGCMIFAQMRGASVTALDMREDRLAFCRDVLGVDGTVVAGADTLERLSALTGGDMFDVVFDATGKAASMNAGFDYVAHGGNLRAGQRRARHDLVRRPEISRARDRAARQPQRDARGLPRSLRAIRDGHVPTDALATHRAPLEQSPERFAEWIRPETGVIKALIEV